MTTDREDGDHLAVKIGELLIMHLDVDDDDPRLSSVTDRIIALAAPARAESEGVRNG